MTKIGRINFRLSKLNHQTESPLFKLPGEIRNQIWEYALSPYIDTSSAYPPATCYARPDFLAPRKTAVALLRACKAVYLETWFLPWSAAELVFFLTWNVRRPPNVQSVDEVQKVLNHLVDMKVDTSTKHVRVFVQHHLLQEGHLNNILRMNHFKPECITITLRHTDFEQWEGDATLHVGSRWISYCDSLFPESVKVIRFEFESLERKKDQIDELAEQAIGGWKFTRKDGVVLSAVIGKDADNNLIGETEVMNWKGKSTWQGLRWVRDEVEPGKLNYYVKTVVWRVRPDNGQETEDEGRRYYSPGLHASRTPFYDRPAVTVISTKELRLAGLTDESIPLDELIQKITDWRYKNPHLRWNGATTVLDDDSRYDHEDNGESEDNSEEMIEEEEGEASNLNEHDGRKLRNRVAGTLRKMRRPISRKKKIREQQGY
ncbi:hypothetical protein ABW20_dc0100231 [Dactylellina cionopaga]|nr:hypothetical protein ABW20_dc0100231 [Dactylellina cionopaga]